MMHHQPRTRALWAKLVRFGFRQLYTRFAWAYDAIAAGVSFGEWQAWGRCAIPFLRGRRILELAHGPGHLHIALRTHGLDVVSIDLSAQMGALARRRIQAFLRRQPSSALHDVRLARADARRLPFSDAAFDSMVSTFPTDFIFTAEALGEAKRVLRPNGALVIVPTAELRTGGAVERLIDGLYHVTAQRRQVDISLIERFASASFSLHTETVETDRARVTVWVCESVKTT
ncbi:MAG: methyltransferase domain-containing protein [Anaerolineae bacterium]|nr:methyltransferase domain-containing protein [Thermoflexales bacterium]MDW8407525.1 methyltransferase domain-containing protein [Anaerolineae bacterium]